MNYIDRVHKAQWETMKEIVYEYLMTVLKGRAVTYGQIAEAMGNRKAAREVGIILHRNPDEEKFP